MLGPVTREWTPLTDREVSKADVPGRGAAALPDSDLQRQELGRVAALAELRESTPWRGEPN